MSSNLNKKIKKLIRIIHYFLDKNPFEQFIIYSSPECYKYVYKIDSIIFKIRYKLFARNSSDFNKNSLTLVSIFKKIFFSIIASLLIISLIIFVNNVFDINSYFIRFFDLDKISTIYSDILIASIQVLGVFLGLYFTVISVVLSTSYANVTQRIRSIILSEQIGNTYIELVSYAGSFSLILLLIFLSFNIISSLGIFIVLILSIFSLFGFLKSMIHFFNLLSPANLMTQIINNIKRNILTVSSDSNQHSFKEIQSVSQKNVENYLLAIFDILRDIKLNNKFDNDTIEKISSDLVNLLSWYSKIKFKIPLNSEWFRVKFEEKSWTIYDFRTSTEIEIAKKAKIATSPDSMNDFFWFEDDILKIFDFGLNIPIKNGDFEIVGKLFYGLNYFIKIYILRNMGLKSFDYLEMLEKSIDRIDFEKYHNKKDIKNLVPIVDIYGYLIVEAVISLKTNLSNFTEKDFYNQLSSEILLDAQLKGYNYALPLEVIKSLGYLSKFLQFEKDVEGKIVTPKNTITELLAASFSQYFKNILYKTMDELDELILNTAKNLFEKNNILAITLIFRGIEANEKFDIEHTKIYYEKLKKLDRLGVNNWQKIDWESLKNRKKELQYNLLKNLSDMILLIDDNCYELLGDYDLPDYLGMSFVFLSDDCYYSMENDNFELFKEIFPKTFMLSLLLNNEIVNNNELSSIDKKKLFRENLMKIIHLLSYAAIYSELYENNYWGIVEAVLDDYSKRKFNADAEKMIEFLDEIIEARPMGLSAQSIERGEWEQNFKFKIKDLIGDLVNIDYSCHEKSIEHESYIIRSLIRSKIDYLMDISRYSISKYLIDNPTLNPKLSDRTVSLLERLKKEKNNEK